MIDRLLKATSDSNWALASKLLYDHWVVNAVECFNVKEKEPWETQFDEKKIDEILFYPLAAALCQEKNCKDKDGKSSINHLAEVTGFHSTNALIAHGQTCGRMFRFGEPTYCCRSCSIDSTCVLCYDCFKNSEHSKHKYKMHTSSGSGYCDCGDIEAFSEFPICSLHTPNEEQKAMMDKTLPKELHNHLHNLTLIALKFIVEFLCLPNGESEEALLPIYDLKSLSHGKHQYQTMLMNDESHTFDVVIRALVVSIDCDEQQAMRLATAVDREGRIVVCYGPKEKCESIRENVQRRTQRETNRRTQRAGPLEVKVLRSSLVSCQQFAVRLINWLTTQVKLFPPLASIVGNVALHDCSSFCRLVSNEDDSSAIPTVDFDTSSTTPACGHHAPCVQFVLSDRQLWKSARLSYHQLLMATVLMHLEQKRNFGRLLIEHYKSIYEDFTNDDHEHKFSIIAMTVQVLTVPTIARFLVREHNAIEQIINYQHEFMDKYLKKNARILPVLDFTTSEFPAVLDRALHSITDLGYLLSVCPKRNDWDSKLRESYLKGAAAFLCFLRDFQHMDEVKRQFTDHQLTESEWETAFNIFIRIEEAIFMMNQWALTDEHVHMNLLTRCMSEIVYQTEHMTEFENRRDVKINGFSASCIEYDIAQSPVSIHQPLWRFAAALFTASPDILANYVCVDDTSDSEITTITENVSICQWEPVTAVGKRNLRGFRSLLMEMPLRCIVLRSQATAQLWRRNGFSLDHQLHYYGNSCRSEMYDRDILMLQVVAAISDPHTFLIRVLDRFSLTRWATFGFEDLPASRLETPSTPSATSEDLSRITVTLAEEMLHLIIILLMERYIPGVGQITIKEALQREVLHVLCTGKKPYSQLERYILRTTYFRKELLHDAVAVVGDFRRPATSTTMGVFSLKSEFYSQYNPFFYHYQKVQISAAEQCQKKDRANESREIKACPPPISPRFEPFFAPVVRLAESQLLTQLISMTFDRYLKSSRYTSEGLLHRALFLCGISLNEQARVDTERAEATAHQRQVPERFRFIERAENLELLDKLKKLETRVDSEVFGDLVWWLIQHYKESQSIYYHGFTEASSNEKPQEKTKPEENLEKSEKSAIAAKKRQQAMDRMARLQKSFKSQHKDLMKEDEPQTSSTATIEHEESLMEVDGKSDFQKIPTDDQPEIGVLPDNSGFPVCLGVNKSVARLRALRQVTCALCQEDEVLTFESAPGIVCAAYVECTRLFAQDPLPPHDPPLQNDDYRYYAPADLHWGTNVSTCAHTMHYSCYRTYVDGLIQRERGRQRQNMAPRTLNYDEKHEYLCPLCRTLCNSAMPLLPVIPLLQGVETFSSGRKNHDEAFGDWVQRMNDLCLVPLYSTNTGDNPIRSHARKRSHSERSLAEYVKESAKEPMLTQNTPIIGSSIASFLNLTSLNASTASSSTNHSPHSSNEGTPLRRTETLTNFLQETLNKLKSILPKQQKVYAPNNFAAFDTLLPFFSSLRQCRMDIIDSDEIVEMLGIYSSTGYVLRCICAVLQNENKPLFGAFNTRQQDCINGMVRLCAVASFTAKPLALRLLASRFLSPFVVPLSANRPVPAQVYPARTLHNSNEIRRIARTFQLRRPVIDPNVASMSDLSTTTISSNSSTAPASPGPSSRQRQQTPQSSQMPSTSSVSLNLPIVKANPFVEMNLLNVDMISMAIQLAMLTGWSCVKDRQFFHNLGRVEEGAPKVPDGSIDEHHCVQLALLGHLFQAFACYKSKENLNDEIKRIHLTDKIESSNENMDTGAELDSHLQHLYSLICGNDSIPDLQELKASVHGSALEFMRPLAVFYNALTLVPPPEALKDPSLDEFESLCRYLAMPVGLKALLEGEVVERLFTMWSSYVRLPQAQIQISRPMKPRALIDLPDDYCELINRAAQFRCPAVKSNELNGPITTMCLLCGEMLCSQSYCCQKTFNHENVGSCSYHMFHCGGNSGIFLRIRECQIIFLTSQKRGCHKAAPYVDEFGETDPGFRRGNPLYLNRELYRKYQRLWLHQEVAEEVLNQYEINYRNLAFEWQHF